MTKKEQRIWLKSPCIFLIPRTSQRNQVGVDRKQKSGAFCPCSSTDFFFMTHCTTDGVQEVQGHISVIFISITSMFSSTSLCESNKVEQDY